MINLIKDNQQLGWRDSNMGKCISSNFLTRNVCNLAGDELVKQGIGNASWLGCGMFKSSH